MTIRREVQDFVNMGPLPPSSLAQEHDIDHRAELLERIAPPVTQEEAESLVKCFGEDECFGLAWTLLHLIETSPQLPHIDESVLRSNEWLDLVWSPRRPR